MESEKDLRNRCPWIEWDEPIKVDLLSSRTEGWACRYCIAQLGFKGTDTDKVFPSVADFFNHLRDKHGRT